jgi:hypothetical protein
VSDYVILIIFSICFFSINNCFYLFYEIYFVKNLTLDIKSSFRFLFVEVLNFKSFAIIGFVTKLIINER